MLRGGLRQCAQLSLSLEKLNFIKLRELHRVACDAEDAQLADFIGAGRRSLRACS
jgi:ferritin heavy chain